jgi:LAO/AO transport system kinase
VRAAALADRVAAGERRALARTLSLIRAGDPDGTEVVAQLQRLRPDPAPVIGITGPPGVGKSSLIAALVGELRRRERRVAVLAIDPSSPFTGGAVLGDRIRMGTRFDAGVYFRSMSSAGELGGLAATALEALEALRHSGYDDVLLETVGVGQNEIDVHLAADISVLVLAPAQGDDAQAAKAGILEIADVVVINKADQDGARAAVRFAREAMRGVGPGGWRRPVLTTVASRDEGVTALVETLDEHALWRSGAGAEQQRAKRRARSEHAIERLAVALLRRECGADGALLSELAAGVATGTTDLRWAAIELLHRAADGQRSR